MLFFLRKLYHRTVTHRPCCKKCGEPFSDWFVWNGWRHCFPCWCRSNFMQTVLEDGRVIDTGHRDASNPF